MDTNSEQYQKALSQFRLNLGGILHPLRRYGQDVYVEQLIPEIVKLALQLHDRLDGKDIPIQAKEFTYPP